MPDGKGISCWTMKGLNARDPQSYSESSAQPIIQTSEAINASQSNQVFLKAAE